MPKSLTETVGHLRSGVVRIETTTCELDIPPSGSGFMVGQDLVGTVAHVVRAARTVSLRTSEGVVRGEVVGADQDSDVAVVRAVRPLEGTILKFAGELPRVADEVAVLGYPLGQPLTATVGAICALERPVEFASQSMSGLIQTNAAVNPGNSGGPMINAQGEVIGLVEANSGEGLAYAVPAGRAEGLIARWSESPVVEPLADCIDPTAHLINIESRHADAPALARTFYGYVDGINEDSYESSWMFLTDRLQGSFGDLDAFVEAQSTSHISDFAIETVSMKDETTDTADVRFTSRQDSEFGRDGQSCSLWHLRYTLRMDSGFWQIDAAKSLGEAPMECSSASG